MRKERRDIPLADILPNTGQVDWLPSNPRQWTAQDINRTARSIKEDTDFLEERPILVFPHDDKFIAFAGNLRREGCIKNKMTTAPCVIHYPETDADQETIKRRAIKDNGNFGSWDFDALANEWDNGMLPDWGVPAWDAEQTQDDADAPEAQEDDFDETADAVETRCQPGDIWQLGNHRLMCGDSTDAASVALLMNGNQADLLLTDPPYNVDYSSKNDYLNKYGKGNCVQEDINNDKMSDAEFAAFLDGVFGRAAKVLKPGGAFYVWTAQGHAQTDIAKALDRAGLFFRQQLVWAKNNIVLGRMDYQGKHEPCFYGWKEGAGHYFRDTRSESTIIEQDKPLRNEYHPTMKPVPLFAQLVENSSREGEIVLDVFGGSGTTLIAAEQLGRKCFMMELDPHYCDIILARWEKLTGQTATKL